MNTSTNILPILVIMGCVILIASLNIIQLSIIKEINDAIIDMWLEPYNKRVLNELNRSIWTNDDYVNRQDVIDLINTSMNDLQYDDENEDLQESVRSLPSASVTERVNPMRMVKAPIMPSSKKVKTKDYGRSVF